MRATLVTCLLAGFLVTVLLVLGRGVEGENMIARTLLLIGLTLFSRDVLESGGTGMGARSVISPLRWIHALHLTLFGYALFSILMWAGPDQIALNLPNAAFFGVSLGVFLAFLPRNGTARTRMTPEFQKDRRASDSVLGRLVYFGWPLMAVVILIMSAYAPPAGGWSGVFPLFQMCFLPFLVTLYPLQGSLVSNFAGHIPRVLGFVALLAGLVAGA